MTSGVKQALPQVLMPKTGAEGKAARNRAPQGDFAEALGIGKSAKQQKSSEAKASRQEVEAKPLWQRLAAKLETAAEHSREIAAKLDAAATSEEPEVNEQGDDKVGEHHEDSDLKDSAASPVARHAADAAQMPALPPASTLAEAEAAGQAASRRHASASHEASLPVDLEPIADGDSPRAPSSPASDNAREQDAAAPIFVPIGRSEQSGPIRFEPAGGPPATPAEQFSADRTQAKEASSEASAEPAKIAPRVTVLAHQSIPAPIPQTSIVLVESIAASDLLEPARSTPALDAIHASATQVSAQSLKIQLHPAELGMVTATLRFVGDQLSIELQVENHEAYRRLSGDSDTIVSSLRDLGYDVDRVTVLQPSLASTPAGRTDSGASMPSPQGRAPEQFGSSASGAGNGGSGGRQSGEGGNTDRNAQQSPAAAREQQGSGLFI
jgi:chemotaxis protein MotD